MTDVAASLEVAPKAAAPKVKKAVKPKKPATHPKYSDMIATALNSLKERSGSSRQAILKYITANYKVGDNAATINAHLKLALKSGVKSGAIKQSKGTGASGSFKVGEAKKAAKKAAKPKAAKPKKAISPKKKAGAKKPSAKKAAKPKKSAKKPAAKKAKSPKKAKTAKKAKSPKPKKAAKSPKKQQKKPKKAKTA
jgi:histone H1/5